MSAPQPICGSGGSVGDGLDAPPRLPAFQGGCSSSWAWIRKSSLGYGAARRTTSGMVDARLNHATRQASPCLGQRVGPGLEVHPCRATLGVYGSQERGAYRANSLVPPHYSAGKRKGAGREVSIQ